MLLPVAAAWADTATPPLLQNLDGQNNIILGTVTGHILVYDLDIAAGTATLVWVKLLPAPVRSLEYQDVVADGLRELLVLTSDTLHVFQVSWPWQALLRRDMSSRAALLTTRPVSIPQHRQELVLDALARALARRGQLIE